MEKKDTIEMEILRETERERECLIEVIYMSETNLRVLGSRETYLGREIPSIDKMLSMKIYFFFFVFFSVPLYQPSRQL